MNKDVIYIEPEDDITDIITKIENSKSKIVALVPPKKAGVFRSVVNIKLIAKSALTSGKNVVLVTADPPIIKLAAATKIPVAKNLQSAPSIPKLEDISEEVVKEELREPVDDSENDLDEESEKDSDEDSEVNAANEDGETNDKENLVSEDNKEDKKSEKKNSDLKTKKASNKFVRWFDEHRKIAIFGGIGGLVLILLMIWAFVIAPAAILTVGIKTDIRNFSEAISFVTKLDEENADEGKFYLEEKKLETVQKIDFEATGEKNIGKKANGDVVVYTYFKKSGSVQIKAGTSFSINGLGFVSDEDAVLSWSGEVAEDCNNNGQTSAVTSGCLVSGRIKVIATGPGEKYNIAASNTGWSTTAGVAVYSDKAMSGGTDDIITVVSEDDVKKAKAKLENSEQVDNKEKLFSEVNDNLMIIEASYEQITEDAISTPAVGEKVESDTKPVLTVKTIAKVYAIDKTKVEEFITKKAKLGENQKIYEIRDPFIENFLKTDSGFSGKLKTSYAAGPKVTENDVVEIVKGKGLGQAQHDLRDISGVASVIIDPSYPWVTSIPNDPNKITVILEVKE